MINHLKNNYVTLHKPAFQLYSQIFFNKIHCIVLKIVPKVYTRAIPVRMDPVVHVSLSLIHILSQFRLSDSACCARRYTMVLIGKTMELKKQRQCGLEKSMDGADLPVFLSEVNGANPVF